MYKAHINGNKIQTCKEHCINTATYAQRCVKGLGVENTAYLCGLIHDAGKCTEEFNNYIENASKGEPVKKGSVIHTFAGVEMILSRYHSAYNHNAETDAFNNLAAELIAIASGSHHGQFDVFNKEESGFEHRFEKQPDYDKKAIRNYYKECATESEIDHLFCKSAEEIQAICLRLNKLLAKTDDIEKNQEFLFYLGLLERVILSSVIEGDRRDTAEFMSDNKMCFPDIVGDKQKIIWENAFDHLMNKIDAFPQETEMQYARRELSDYCEAFAENPCGVYRLNLPTGAGKTLSSLRYALAHAKKFNKKRIIFAIPLLSILDQNAKVIKEAVGDDSIILEHHSNVVQEIPDDETPSKEVLKRNMLIDTWESPIIITTLVQLLNTMFDGKTTSIRRFHSLIDSVVIIDEVQSVPVKMLSLFNLTLNFLSRICNTTFILCSATQPLLEQNTHKLLISKKEVVSDNQLEKYKKTFKRTNVQYIGELNEDETIQQVKEYFQKYKSVLLICNTKDEAKNFFYKANSITDNCFHLSTSMCMAHRKEVIKIMTEKLKNKESLICISTQVIEAGVDISFGSVIRLAAGIDNIAQAAGRANRNGELENLAPVGIVFLKGENLSYLKEISRAKNITGELISEYKKDPESFENDLISTSSISYYYEKFFQDIKKNNGLTDYSVKNLIRCDGRSMGRGSLLDLLACNSVCTSENPGINTTMRQAFKLAGENFKVFDEGQIFLIVPYGNGEEIIGNILSDRFTFDIPWAKKILKEAKEYTVSLYANDIEKFDDKRAVYFDRNETVRILNPDYYDDKLGVIKTKGDKDEWNTQIL